MNRLQYYVPNLIQFCYHIAVDYVKALFGGNRSGKTTCNVVEFLWHMTKWYPSYYPQKKRLTGKVKGRIVCETFTKSVAEVITDKLDEWIPQDELVRREKNQQGYYTKYYFKDGSFFDIMTYEQDVKLHEGADRDIVLFDEPPPRKIYVAQKRGLVDRRGTAMFGLTPLNQPWLFDEIYESEETGIVSFISDIRDNLARIINQEYVNMYERVVPKEIREQYLKLFKDRPVGCHTEEAIRDFEKTLTEQEIEARIHGKFLHLSGLIYPIFNKQVHVVKPFDIPHHWPRYFGLDPHDRKPQTCLWAAVNPNEDVFFYREREYHPPMIIDDCVKAMKEVERQHDEKIIRRMIDPNFGAKRYANTGRTVAQEYAHSGLNQGYRMTMTMANDDVAAGHKKVTEYLYYNDEENKMARCFFFSTLTRTIHMMTHYLWDEWTGNLAEERDPKEKPKDKNKDFPDVVRYMLMDNPRYQAPKIYKPKRTVQYA